jgi:hypothetical protein
MGVAIIENQDMGKSRLLSLCALETLSGLPDFRGASPEVLDTT